MKSKERALMALNHEEPDRVPMDCGGRQTTFMKDTYEKLKNHLGLQYLTTRMMSQKWQSTYVDDIILERFNIDFRHVRPPLKSEPIPPEGSADGWRFADEWGVTRQLEDGYATICEYPLKDFKQTDLDTYAWPDPKTLFDYSQIGRQARELHTAGEFAVVGCMGSPGNTFEQAWYLRGFSEFLLDLAANKEFAHALMAKVLEIRKTNARCFLEEVGPYLDVIQLADDLAMQSSPYMSLEMYREMIKPYQADLIQTVKQLTPAKIYYHSCGAVTSLLDDLIEIGVDILNPVQVTASGMAPVDLKRRFGKKLCFWGAIDTTWVLPKGNPAEVREAVNKVVDALAPGGGYVLASVHNMQTDVPPENVVAMFEAAVQCGQYPIGVGHGQ